MSFSNEIKKELCRYNIKSTCCRRAFAAGVSFCAVRGTDDFSVCLPSGDVAEYAAKMLREKNKSNPAHEKSCVPGRDTERLRFGYREKNETIENGFRCNECPLSFLRGVFVVAGTVSNPHSSTYHAEFRFNDANDAKKVYGMLEQIGCTPKIVNRKDSTGLYYKSSVAIEELLVKLGATSSAFELMNCKIERTIRNEENRATNCVTKNISKTVNASRRQIDDIEELIAAGRLETMPYDLRVTARLRMDNPDVSLSELAALHKPPISKSGLNHRFEKISEEVKKMSEM